MHSNYNQNESLSASSKPSKSASTIQRLPVMRHRKSKTFFRYNQYVLITSIPLKEQVIITGIIYLIKLVIKHTIGVEFFIFYQKADGAICIMPIKITKPKCDKNVCNISKIVFVRLIFRNF